MLFLGRKFPMLFVIVYFETYACFSVYLVDITDVCSCARSFWYSSFSVYVGVHLVCVDLCHFSCERILSNSLRECDGPIALQIRAAALDSKDAHVFSELGTLWRLTPVQEIVTSCTIPSPRSLLTVCFCSATLGGPYNSTGWWVLARVVEGVSMDCWCPWCGMICGGGSISYFVCWCLQAFQLLGGSA